MPRKLKGMWQGFFGIAWNVLPVEEAPVGTEIHAMCHASHSRFNWHRRHDKPPQWHLQWTHCGPITEPSATLAAVMAFNTIKGISWSSKDAVHLARVPWQNLCGSLFLLWVHSTTKSTFLRIFLIISASLFRTSRERGDLESFQFL